MEVWSGACHGESVKGGATGTGSGIIYQTEVIQHEIRFSYLTHIPVLLVLFCMIAQFQNIITRSTSN